MAESITLSRDDSLYELHVTRIRHSDTFIALCRQKPGGLAVGVELSAGDLRLLRAWIDGELRWLNGPHALERAEKGAR